jgi:hypothetical protein
MSAQILYYLWTVPVGEDRTATFSVYADSLDEAYASLQREVEQLSAVVRNPPRYIVDPVATHKLCLVAAATFGPPYSTASSVTKRTTLPASFMGFLDSAEPKIMSVETYGLRLDRETPTIC